MQDSIEKTIDLKAPIARVWQAITDHEQFGQWFRARVDQPFVVGEVSTGQITYPGYEHMKWRATIRTIVPETLFAFSWYPYNDDPEMISTELETHVEFKLKPIPDGTRLTITESGFESLPDDPRRLEAWRVNSEGWELQIANIQAHVES